MSKKAYIQHSEQSHHLKKINNSQRLKLVPLTHSIRELIALGGLAIGTSAAWADTQINPNEIWLNPGFLKGICVRDMDQDGDLDVFNIYKAVVTQLENTGTPESPEFAAPIPFTNDIGNFNLNRLGLTDCRFYENTPVLVMGVSIETRRLLIKSLTTYLREASCNHSRFFEFNAPEQ